MNKAATLAWASPLTKQLGVILRFRFLWFHCYCDIKCSSSFLGLASETSGPVQIFSSNSAGKDMLVPLLQGLAAQGLELLKIHWIRRSLLVQQTAPEGCGPTASGYLVVDRTHDTALGLLKGAGAYLDQLERSQALPLDQIADLNKAIGRTQKSHLGKKELAKLHGKASSVETKASPAKSPEDANRLHALAKILQDRTV